MSGDIFYRSALHASTITNLAADRANIAHLRSGIVQVDTLIVETDIQLPDGALLINSSGAGAHLTTDPSGGVLTNEAFSLKTLTSTDGSIVITPSATEIDLSAIGVGNVSSVTPVAPPGPGEETLIVSQTGAVTLKNIASGGPSISIGADADSVIITGPTLADAGPCDAPLVVDGAGPTFTVRGIEASTGIQLSSTLTCVEIGTNLVAGGGIALAPAVLPATDITIFNTGVTSVTHTVAPIAGEGDIVNGPPATGNVQLKILQPGTGGISLDSSNANYIKIDGTTPTFTAGTGDEPLFDGSPLATFTPTFKSLTAGTGVSLSADANAITINAAGGVTTIDQTVAPGANEATLIVGPPATGAVQLKNVLGGTNLTVTANANDVTIDTVASPSFTNMTVSGTVGGTGNSNLRINDFIITDGTAQRYPVVETATANSNNFAVVIGTGANLSGAEAIAIGHSATAGNAGTISIGAAAHDVLAAVNAVAIGNNARGGSTQTVAIGINSDAQGSDCVAIGNTAIGSQDAVVLGHNATGSATNGIAIGVSSSSSAGGGSSIAVGNSSQSLNTSSIAIGQSSTAQGVRAVAVGAPNVGAAAALATDSVAIGTDASVVNVGIGSVAIGNTATVSGVGAPTNSVAVGTSATVNNVANAIAIGTSATSAGAGGVVIGNACSNSSTSASTVLIGDTCSYNSTGAGQIAVGSNIALTGSGGDRIAIGSSVSCAGAGSIAIGASASVGTGTAPLIGIGQSATVTGTRGLAIGNNNASNVLAGGTDSIAIGTDARVTAGTEAIVIGEGSTTAGANSIVLGSGLTGIATSLIVGANGTTWWRVGPTATYSQATSNVTTVTITGAEYQFRINMFGTVNAGVATGFSCSHASVTTSTVIILTTSTNGGSASTPFPAVFLGAQAAGSFTISVHNPSGVNWTSPRIIVSIYN